MNEPAVPTEPAAAALAAIRSKVEESIEEGIKEATSNQDFPALVRTMTTNAITSVACTVAARTVQLLLDSGPHMEPGDSLGPPELGLNGYRLSDIAPQLREYAAELEKRADAAQASALSFLAELRTEAARQVSWGGK